MKEKRKEENASDLKIMGHLAFNSMINE